MLDGVASPVWLFPTEPLYEGLRLAQPPFRLLFFLSRVRRAAAGTPGPGVTGAYWRPGPDGYQDAVKLPDDNSA